MVWTNLIETVSLPDKKLSSPEAALLLRDAYDNQYLLRQPDDVEAVLGATLYREDESVTTFAEYGRIVDEYTALDIKKFFGYTLDEWLDLTIFETNTLKKKALELQQKMTEAAEQMQKEMRLGNSTNKMDQRAINMTTSTLEDFTNGTLGF